MPIDYHWSLLILIRCDCATNSFGTDTFATNLWKTPEVFAISRNLLNTHLICIRTSDAAASRVRSAKCHRRSPFIFSWARCNLSLGNTQLGAHCMRSTSKSFNSRKTGPNFVGESLSPKPCMHFNNATKSFVPRALRKRSKLWYKFITVMDGSATNFDLHRSAATALGWLTRALDAIWRWRQANRWLDAMKSD